MALNMAVDTFTEPGDSIIVNTPAYPALTGAVEKWGRILKESPLIFEGGRFTIDFDGLERLADQGTRAYILCNPHNPTGRVWEEEAVAAGILPGIGNGLRHDLRADDPRRPPGHHLGDGARAAVPVSYTHLSAPI